MTRSAVVIGGGIGGLAAALGLRRVGWRATVLERAPVLADAGAGISLAANGVRALDALGVGAEVREAARPCRSGGTRTPAGRWLSRLDGAAMERAVGTPMVGIPRAALHRVMRDGLPPGALRVGAEATEVTPDDDGHTMRVRCGDEELRADVVVAADGARSPRRGQLFPDHPGLAHGGQTVLRAITDTPVDCGTDFELTWGRGVEFGHLALADGRAEWHAVFTAPPGVRYADPLGEVRRRLDGWHDPIPALLAATRPEAVLHHDVHELVAPLPSYVSGRTVLLGDAAHAMSPNLGQGASQALEDAVTLAAALAGTPDIDTALARYDAERRPRGQAVSRASRQAGRMGQRLANPVAVALRNTVLRLTPSAVSTRTVLRHARWTPPALG